MTCVATTGDDTRNEVYGVVLITSRRDGLNGNDSHFSDNNGVRPSTVAVYTATSVYSEIDDDVGESAPVADEHHDRVAYEVLTAEFVAQQSALPTVPVYISLLSDDETEESHTNHSPRPSACITETQLPVTSETEQV